MARVIGPIATALAVSETQTGVDVSVQFDAPGGWQRLRNFPDLINTRNSRPTIYNSGDHGLSRSALWPPASYRFTPLVRPSAFCSHIPRRNRAMHPPHCSPHQHCAASVSLSRCSHCIRRSASDALTAGPRSSPRPSRRPRLPHAA